MRSFSSLICFLILWTGLAHSSQPTEQLDTYTKQLMERWGITGMSIAVAQEGKLLFHQGYGLADLEKKAPVSADTIFTLSSSTKMFAGTAAMLLMEQGKLDLDRSARSYLPQMPEAWGEITVRMLLSHLSGLPDVITCDMSSYDAAWDCISKKAPDAEPMTRFIYNQTNYMLILSIIEKQSGQDFPSFVAENILRPAGMSRTVFEGNYQVEVPGRAKGYVPNREGKLGIREVTFPSFLYTAAGANSSSLDLVAFMNALVKGKILKPDTLKQMWRTPLVKGEPSHYAMGWDMQKHGNGHTSFGHEGGGLTTLRYFQKADLLVVVLLNGKKMNVHPDQIALDVGAMFEPELYTAADQMISQMWSGINQSNVRAAIEAYRNFIKTDEGKSTNTERTLNSMGYNLMALGLYKEAITILALNVERYPKSGNVYDSLGEAYLKDGQKDKARTSYKKSLELDPQNDNAAKILKEKLTAD